jgi:hypothetical protein
MKVMYNLKNMINQEFQHCLESRLIAVMIHNMPMIQCGSNVNLIQIQSSQPNLDWTTSNSNSTFIEFSRVRTTNSLFELERMQHESEEIWNDCEYWWILINIEEYLID